MIEPWGLNHPHGLSQLCHSYVKWTTGQGQGQMLLECGLIANIKVAFFKRSATDRTPIPQFDRLWMGNPKKDLVILPYYVISMSVMILTG